MLGQDFRSPDDDGIELAVSGGGYRATAFALGATLCLLDTGLLSKVVSISSVSGGSFLNAYLEARGTLRSNDVRQARAQLLDLAAIIAERSAFWPDWRAAVAYLKGLGVLLIGIAVAAVVILMDVPGCGALALVAISVAAYTVFAMRGSILLRTLSMTFKSAPNPSSVGVHGNGPQLEPRESVRHVYCVSELRSGRPLYFIGGTEVFSPEWGWGNHDLDPFVRVLASAAFPGLCHPLLVQAASLHLGAPVGMTLALCDGGVTNNLGTQWYEADPERVGFGRRYESPLGVLRLVVDASAPPVRDAAVRRTMTPLSEFRMFLRQVSVLYENTVTPRVFELLRAATTPGMDDSEIATLTSDPVEQAGIANVVQKTPTTQLVANILAGMTAELHTSAQVATRASTTLKRLGSEVTARIIQHGYAVTLASVASRVDHRREVSVPSFDELKALIAGATNGRKEPPPPPLDED